MSRSRRRWPPTIQRRKKVKFTRGRPRDNLREQRTCDGSSCRLTSGPDEDEQRRPGASDTSDIQLSPSIGEDDTDAFTLGVEVVVLDENE
jgi:hypothetical protein